MAANEGASTDSEAAVQAGDQGVSREANMFEMTAPIPFVMLNEDNTFEINADAMAYLRQIKGSIAVVSIAGLYRTGKSYLLNLLLGREQTDVMFTVGATVNACTKGIWIWGQPLAQMSVGTRDSGMFQHLRTDTTIVFMDTEGLGSTDRSQTQDARIFALALLLSSLFIYNSRGVIDSNAIDDLSLVVHLTKFVQTKAQAETGEGVTSDFELARFFPQFLWVVRDFTLQLQEGGQAVTARDYFESALRPQPVVNDDVSEKNKIRSLVKTFFPNRDCLTMVRPLNDEELLRNLTGQPYESLRSEFREQMGILKEKVFASVKPKKMMANLLNGSMLATLATNYVDAFNSGQSPVITNVWDRVVANQFDEALDNAKTVFVRKFDTQTAELSRPHTVNGALLPHPLNDVDLYAIYDSAQAAAEAELVRAEIDAIDTLETYTRHLSAFTLDYLSVSQIQNDSRSRAFNEALLRDLYHPPQEDFIDISSLLSADNERETQQSDTDGARVLHDKLTATRSLMEDTITKYNERARGPAKGSVLADFLADNLVNQLLDWGTLVKTAFRFKYTEVESHISTARQVLLTAEGKSKAASEYLAQQKASYEQALISIGERIADERAILREQIDSKQGEIDRAQSQFERLARLHKDVIDRLNAQLEQATQDRKEVEEARRNTETRRENARMASRRQLLESERTFHQDEKDLLQSQQDLLQKVVELERQLGEQDTDHMKEVFRLEKENQAQLVALQSKCENDQESLKEKMIQDIRQMKDGEDKILRALQDDLSDQKALFSALQERLDAKEAMHTAKRGGKGNKEDEECVLQ